MAGFSERDGLRRTIIQTQNVMGDRYDRKRGPRERLAYMRGKPPPTILSWGLGQPAAIGHNNGPPLEEEAPGYLWRRHSWKKAYQKAWKTPPMDILKFRVARAEAAGVTYEQYMLELLDTGRHLQKSDVEERVLATKLPTGSKRGPAHGRGRR